jgi:hypothetical protein
MNMKKYALILTMVSIVFSLQAQNQCWDDQFTVAGSVNNTVHCIKIDANNDVYVSGAFTLAGGTAANYVAKWDGSTWTTLGSGFNGPVYAIEFRNSNVVAGGLFTMAGGVAASNLAIWDGTAWAAAGTGTNGVVRTIKFYDPFIYVGGEFTSANGMTVSNIFRTNGTVWEDMNGGVNGPVYSIDVRNYTIAGGRFTMAGTTPVSNIATWNTTAWTAMTDGLNDTVHTVKFTITGIYAGGAFTQSGTSSCSRIAMFDAGMWKPLGDGFDNTVFSISVQDSLLYAGGRFLNSGTTSVSRIAKYSNLQWNPLGDGTNASVRATALAGFDLFCGGTFTQAGLNPSLYFGRYGALPVVLLQPQTITVCEGQELEIDLDVWSSETVTYVWKKDGIVITAPGSATLNINPVAVSDAGTYTCEMTNMFGTTISGNIEVTVNALPAIIIDPSDATVCEGDSITWVTNATSGLPVTYTWMHNGNPVAGVTVPELIINGITPADAGTWYVQVQNACGTDVSDNFVLTVNPLPAVTISGLLSDYCFTGAADTVQYSPAGGLLSGPNLNGDIFLPYGLVGDHVFSYTYTDGNGCSATALHNIHVFNPTPVSISGYDVFYCLSAPNDTLHGLPAGGYFSAPVINDSIFSPSAAGEGTFDVAYYYLDGNGCLNGDTVSIVVMQQVSFLYPGLVTKFCDNEMPYTIPVFPPNGTFSGTGIINGNQFDPILAGLGSHTITYEFQDPWGCSGTDVITLSVSAAPQASITNILPNTCNNTAPFILTGAPAGGTFQGQGVSNDSIFTPSALLPGITTLYYYYTDSSGCKDTAVVLTEILQVEQAFFTGMQPFYCQNELNDTLTGIPAGGTFSGPGITGNIFDPAAAGTGVHTLYYTYQNPNECVSQDSVSIMVSDNPPVACGTDYEICAGEMVNITAVFDPGNELFWSTGDTTETITVQPPSSILIIATVYDGICFNADSVEITVHALPSISIPDSVEACNEYTLTAGGSYPAYLWSTGSSNASVVVNSTDNYSVTVTDSYGCTNADTSYVEVMPGPLVELGINRIITEDDAITFIVNSGYDDYLWSDGTTGNSIVFDGGVYGVGTYTVWVFAQNDNGCFDTDSVFVTVNPGIFVESEDYQSQVNVFPNPASQFVNFSFGDLTAPDRVVICDITGKEVPVITVNSADVPGTIDISRLSNGLYLVHFYFGNTCVIKKLSVK